MHIQLPHSLVAQLPDAHMIHSLIEAALQAVEPGAAVSRSVHREGDSLLIDQQRYDLTKYQRVFLIGIGKAALPMSNALAQTLGDHLTGGVVVTKSLAGRKLYPSLERVRVMRGNHPVPGKQSLEATQQVLELIKGRRKEDLFFFLISGGGSALFTWPVAGVSLADIQQITELLLACGADIDEMNVIRKHLDQVKGGGICRMVSPATLVTFVLSDVIGNRLDVVASGPTVADASTFSDALDVIRKYHLESRIPDAIVKTFEAGAMGVIDETVRAHDPCLRLTQIVVVGSNFQAAKAALDVAAASGWSALLLTTALQGEARHAGANLAGILRQVQTTGHPLKPPVCLIAGGETTVTVQGEGLGGRNLEVALGSVALLSGLGRVLLFTLSTDGEDGPTDAAGAVVTGKSQERGRLLGLDVREFLRRNDAYHYFATLGDLIKTGSTGTNVNDLTFLLAW